MYSICEGAQVCQKFGVYSNDLTIVKVFLVLVEKSFDLEMSDWREGRGCTYPLNCNWHMNVFAMRCNVGKAGDCEAMPLVSPSLSPSP